jgi:hypothetical protein
VKHDPLFLLLTVITVSPESVAFHIDLDRFVSIVVYVE